MVFERQIILSSIIARKKDSSNKPENFVIRFDRPLILPQDKRYGAALVRLQGSYSWHNIEQQYGNNLIKYSVDGITYKNILFPDGVYSYSDINDYIHFVMKENGDFLVVDAVDTFNINVSFNLTTFLVIIDITGGYTLDLTSQNFSDLLGYNVGIITTTSQGARLPDITRGIDNLYVHMNIIKDSMVNGSNGDVIFAYETGQLIRSYSYTFEPSNLIFSPVAVNQIDEIRTILTPPSNNPLDLNGIDMSYVIVIREM